MRKSDLEILKNIKREEALARGQVVAATTVSDAGINFDVWWADVAKTLKVPGYLKDVVWADFRARGLAKSATKAKFDEAMRQFGYQL